MVGLAHGTSAAAARAAGRPDQQVPAPDPDYAGWPLHSGQPVTSHRYVVKSGTGE
jgi:hypothetical protein